MRSRGAGWRGGGFYKHDRRLELLQNTVAAPVINSTEAAAVAVYAESACPTTTKSFVNAGGCRRSRTCAPTTYAATRPK
eukprot:SAG22_NODE_14_length_33165_cov_13.196698_17_plen_79_part_00